MKDKQKTAAKAETKETKKSSLIAKWMLVVTMTIVVSFVIFSIVIYTTVSKQSITEQHDINDNAVTILNGNLEGINQELTVSNVVTSLSPSTKRLLNGGPTIYSNGKSSNSVFSDDLVSSFSNPDLSIVVYNRHNEVVFANGSATPKLSRPKGESKSVEVRRKNKVYLMTYSRVRSTRTGKTTGYIVVQNTMSEYNKLMSQVLRWMIIISIIAIIAFTAISYLLVSGVVKPIKEISRVARKVNKDPDSDVRIRELHRNDELEDLALSFNQMLDRMQRYIDQQKEFVSDVSHELRTPVAVIEGHLNMLERWGKDDPEILAESISASLQEADRMKHLIQEMLDLTRAEQINVNYPYEVTNVTEVLRREVSDMQLVHQDFKLQLDMEDLPEDAQIQIYHGHLEQLLVILIDNGIKYSTNRKQINISAGVSGKMVRIMVQDFGEGISEEDQKKIFNRFYRVDKARTREKGGNGLGLSIAQKLVKSYNGKISVESAEGQGSQFKLEFPLLSTKEVAELAELKAQKAEKLQSNK